MKTFLASLLETIACCLCHSDGKPGNGMKELGTLSDWNIIKNNRNLSLIILNLLQLKTVDNNSNAIRKLAFHFKETFLTTRMQFSFTTEIFSYEVRKIL